MAESRESLVQKRAITKRRITNLIKKIDPIWLKEERTQYDIVCAGQYLDEIRELNNTFQSQHIDASASLDPTNEEQFEKNLEELDSHDDRIRDNISKLLYVLNLASKPQDAKSTESKSKRSLEAKWNRITKGINNLTAKTTEAQDDLADKEINDLTDIRSQLFDLEKTLDHFTSEVEAFSANLEDSDGEKWNDAISDYFDKIKATQDQVTQLITQRRRDETRKNKEREIEKEQNRSKELELQNNQHREELTKLFQEFKTKPHQDEAKTVKLPSLNIPTFDGEPTKWKSYWQQFEATIHNSKKLDDQLRMQYLLKSLTTQKAKDAIEGIDAVAEAYPEAVAALKARFDRPQVIHRAHVRALLNVSPVKNGSSMELRQLHDTLQHHLRSLKAMDKLDFERFITALGESKLDPLTMVEWQKFTQLDKDVPDYHKFLEFLDLRSTATELTSFDAGHKKVQVPTKKLAKSVAVYSTNTHGKCPACHGAKHNIAYCPSFKEKSVGDKRNLVQEQGLCFNCLKGKHMGKHCPSPNCCLKCGKRHHTFLHLSSPPAHPPSEETRQDVPMLPTSSTTTNTQATNSASVGTITSATYATMPEVTTSNSVLMMTAEVLLSGSNGHQMIARALLDPASTASFVTERAAQHLMLCGQKQEISINGIWGTQCPTQSSTVVEINLSSTQHTSCLNNVQAIVLPSLTKHLPLKSLPTGYWPHLSSLELADPGFNVSKPIDVLLGVDVYHNILKPGLILGPKGTPAAQETIFGWVLFGGTSGQQPPNEVMTLHATTSIPSCDETLQKFWTLEEPPKARLPLAPLDKLVVQDFDQRHKRDETGRFVVRLPFKPQSSSLGESRPQALRRFLSLERRLQRTSQFDDYAKVVTEYLTSGHAEKVPDEDLNKPASNAFYLAHHAVYKESATTPLRVVFDGSMKTATPCGTNCPPATQ